MTRLVRKKDLVTGTGPSAAKGDTLTADLEGYLTRGDLAFTEKGIRFVLGRRNVIAGIEYGVLGMNEGGTRELRVPPHLAYGEKGVGSVPPRAALRVVVKLNKVEKAKRT